MRAKGTVSSVAVATETSYLTGAIAFGQWYSNWQSFANAGGFARA